MPSLEQDLENLKSEIQRYQKWMAAMDNRLMDLSEEIRKLKEKLSGSSTSRSIRQSDDP